MLKDPTEFRERFLRWKKGELVYENGLALPAYEDGLTARKKSEVNTNEATYVPNEDLYKSRYTLPEVTVTGTNKRPHTHAPIHYSNNAYKMLTGDLLGAMTTGMNVLSPSQWYGAVRDADGIQDGFNKLMRGNSGFVTENFEREHPYISLGANLIGDAAILGGSSGVKNLNQSVNKSNFYRAYKVSNAINTGVKENSVITAYNRNPATKDLGTLWDYQSYLNEMFPNSKIKDVLWHGSKVRNLQSFSTDAIGSNAPIKGSTGIYLAPERYTAASYGRNGDVYPVLLNTENPFVTDQIFGGISKNGVNVTKISPEVKNTRLAQNDAVIAPKRGEVAFFNPDNAVVLGSNKDLLGFKSYMLKNKVGTKARILLNPKSDAEWDAAYNAALKSGDTVEALRLRDLHFRVKAPNSIFINNGKITPSYHGSTKSFNSFDTNKIGSTTGDKSGFYFTNSKTAANFYAHETGSPWENLKLLLGISKSHKPKIYRTYLNVENPYSIDFKGSYDKIGREGIIKEAFNGDKDVVLLNNIIDGPPALSHNVRVIKNPQSIKSADAITYDDAGNIIPLSKRDNFNINDIRYSLLPIIGTTGCGMYNSK